MSKKLQNAVYVHDRWVKFAGFLRLMLGAVMMLLLVAPVLHNVTIASSLLVTGSFIYLAHATIFWRREWLGFLLHVLAGVVYMLVGYFMFVYPLINLSIFVPILAMAYVIMGLFRVGVAAAQGINNLSWSWTFLSGVVDIVLACILIWNKFFLAYLEPIKLLSIVISIEFLFSGLAIFLLGVYGKQKA